MSSDPLDRIRAEAMRMLGPGPAKAQRRLREVCKEKAIETMTELVDRSGLSRTEFAAAVLDLDESTVRQYLETGRGLHLLNVFMFRDEDAAVFVELYLKFLEERRATRERRTG